MVNKRMFSKVHRRDHGSYNMLQHAVVQCPHHELQTHQVMHNISKGYKPTITANAFASSLLEETEANFFAETN